MSKEDNDTVYRRIIIIHKKKDAVLLDDCQIGPAREEDHLREIFANTPKLKNIKGKFMKVKTIPLCGYQSLNIE